MTINFETTQLFDRGLCMNYLDDFNVSNIDNKFIN